MSLRYGIIDKLDAGYKYAFGAHAIDARFQFLDSASGTLDGSIGLQFSQQSYELPSFAGLDKIGELLGFEMVRSDLLVPAAFSIPFGDQEKYGALSFGAVAGYTFLSYGLDPHDLVHTVDGVDQLVEKVSNRQGFATFGGFFHIKLGFERVYAGAGLAVYHQDFGSFALPDGSAFDLSGITLVPTVQFEARL